MLGSVVSPVLAVEQKVEDSKVVKDVSSKMFRKAKNLITQVERSAGIKLIPMYNKAKMYSTTLRGVKTIIGKIPLKSDKPALFIFAKNNLKTIAIVEIIDLRDSKVIYYVVDNKHRYTKVASLPFKERMIEDSKFGQVIPLWITDPNPQTEGTHEIITYFSARGVGLSRGNAMTHLQAILVIQIGTIRELIDILNTHTIPYYISVTLHMPVTKTLLMLLTVLVMAIIQTDTFI